MLNGSKNGQSLAPTHLEKSHKMDRKTFLHNMHSKNLITEHKMRQAAIEDQETMSKA